MSEKAEALNSILHSKHGLEVARHRRAQAYLKRETMRTHIEMSLDAIKHYREPTEKIEAGHLP